MGWLVGKGQAYERLCIAPCDITLPAGTEAFALSQGSGSPVDANAVTVPAGRSRLVGTFESNRGLRIAGLVTAIVGGAAGLGLVIAGSVTGESDGYGSKDPNKPLLYAGVGVALGSAVTGLILASRRDHAAVSVSHNYVPPLPSVTGLALSGTL